jgi:hypothetical protein
MGAAGEKLLGFGRMGGGLNAKAQRGGPQPKAEKSERWSQKDGDGTIELKSIYLGGRSAGEPQPRDRIMARQNHGGFASRSMVQKLVRFWSVSGPLSLLVWRVNAEHAKGAKGAKGAGTPDYGTTGPQDHGWRGLGDFFWLPLVTVAYCGLP